MAYTLLCDEPYLMQVVSGCVNLTAIWHLFGCTRTQVDNIWVFDAYDHDHWANDIALLQLSDPLPVKDEIESIDILEDDVVGKNISLHRYACINI